MVRQQTKGYLYEVIVSSKIYREIFYISISLLFSYNSYTRMYERDFSSHCGREESINTLTDS
jgi:hypothetical protein